MPCFIVCPKQDGYSIRDYLRCIGVSATVIKAVKYTDSGIVLNGSRCHTNSIVHAGDELSFDLPIEVQTFIVPQNLPIDIVYESDAAMVINKPAGQTIHPTRGYSCDTLANAYCGLMKARDTLKPFRPVNRLDRNTSGLVLCAQNVMSASFMAHNVSKIYYAVTQGELPLGGGKIDKPIALCEGSIIKRCVSDNGKISQTDYEVLAAKGGISLVKVMPVTGRTHQIRVHFANMGFPLMGDDMYGGSVSCISRHALHCAKLCFTEQNAKEPVNIAAPLPADMQALLVSRGIHVIKDDITQILSTQM